MPLINTPVVSCGGRRRQLLFGDRDGDGDVDNLDLFLFRSAYLSALGDLGYDPAFDSDKDGDVDNLDLFRFRANFGRRI